MARPGVVIVGFSTRAAAECARAAGFDCAAVDAFGDLDQRQWARSLGLQRDLGRRYSPAAAVAAARRFDVPQAAYVGNLENHPAAVARLARGRSLLGNPAPVLERARDLRGLQRALRRAGIDTPRSLFEGRTPARGRWLVKPLRGGGGQGVREVPQGTLVATGRVAQERIEGVPGSVSFLADGRRALVLGFARGLAGDPRFGARGFRYCGSLLPFALPRRAQRRLQAAVQELALAFGLLGLNGLDFVLRGDEPFALELNPRFSASMELFVRAGARELFALHAEACAGRLPARPPDLGAGVWGKAVLWADADVAMPDTTAWLARADVRDVPFPGERIPRGAPVCTVLAHAPSLADCHAALADRADALRRTFSAAEVPA
jgi:hypothetical protein